MPKVSRTYLLLQERLGGDLAEHVAKLREDGASWHAIAIDLHTRTEVAVTSESIRIWFPDLPRGRGKASDEAVA